MTNFLINLMINLCLMLDTNAFSDLDTGSLQTWTDPTDGIEAIYIQAADDTCHVYFDSETHVITITFCDDDQ